MKPYHTDKWLTLLCGDAREALSGLPSESVHTLISSPPYFRQRLYGTDPAELGRETSVGAYMQSLLDVLGEARRVLRADGTAWINLGDTYDHKTGQLLGVPFEFALAMANYDWLLRSTIIWSKPDPSPEPVTDRPTISHEYVFLFSKQRKYYYDIDATRLPHSEATLTRVQHRFSPSHPSGIGGDKHGTVNPGDYGVMGERWAHPKGRNRRTVWEIPTVGYAGAHFATFPPELIKPMILAGAPEGGVVLDPFAGSGTVGMVANSLSRQALLIELYADNCAQIMLRAQGVPFGL